MSRTQFATRQNLLTRSEEMTNAAWSVFASNVVVTGNDATAPDGTATADLITPNGGVNRHYAAQAVTIPAPYQFSPRRVSISCFLKAKGATQWVNLGNDRHTDFVYAWFDLTNGVVGSVTANSATAFGVSNRIQSVSTDPKLVPMFPSSPAGWYLCTMTYVMRSPGGGGGVNSDGILVGPASADAVQSWDSALALECWAWGASLAGGANWTGPYQQTVAAVVNTGSIRSLP